MKTNSHANILPPGKKRGLDPRIHVSMAHLKSLEAAAQGLNFLSRQPAASVLNGRHASRLRGAV